MAKLSALDPKLTIDRATFFSVPTPRIPNLLTSLSEDLENKK